eukprot:28906-Eustigmatos_ZCMA.PRE.1
MAAHGVSILLICLLYGVSAACQFAYFSTSERFVWLAGAAGCQKVPQKLATAPQTTKPPR